MRVPALMRLLPFNCSWQVANHLWRCILLANAVMATALSGCDGPTRPGPVATSAATAATEPARLNDAADHQFAVAPLEVLRLARLAEAAAVQAGDKKEQARALKYQGRPTTCSKTTPPPCPCTTAPWPPPTRKFSSRWPRRRY